MITWKQDSIFEEEEMLRRGKHSPFLIKNGYRLLNFVKGNFFPNTYVASDISDFVYNKSEIEPTRMLMPIGILFNGYALVSLEKPVTYHPRGADKATLRCDEESLDVRIGYPLGSNLRYLERFTKNRARFSDLPDGKRIHGVTLLYSQRLDATWATMWHRETNRDIIRELDDETSRTNMLIKRLNAREATKGGYDDGYGDDED